MSPLSNLSKQEQTIMNLDREHAIEVIMNLYGNEIKRYVFTFMKNHADTDDVTQEVFVTVYQKLHTFQGRSSLKSWIYSIATNKCKDHLRSWQVRNRNLKEKLKKNLSKNQENILSLEDKVVKNSESKELLQQILQLPIKYREVIILYYFYDFSTVEMSKILQTKDATIRTRLRRGRDQLRSMLRSERGEQFGAQITRNER